MSANSLPQTPAINVWLSDAKRQLSEIGISSAKLDAEIILAYALGKNRTYLHAHGDTMVENMTLKKANHHLTQRLGYTPIAYLVGEKEFYGRKFKVTPDTLIPRPESEDIITVLSQILQSSNYKTATETTALVDVGTGSGCLGISAKLEFPKLDVTLTDISKDALTVASTNAKELSADVAIIKSDLLQEYNKKPNIVIANLPYVDKEWDRSRETNYEPSIAIFADRNGLEIIEHLIEQACNIIEPGGYLIIEADPSQHQALIDNATKHLLFLSHQLGYVIAFERIISD